MWDYWSAPISLGVPPGTSEIQMEYLQPCPETHIDCEPIEYGYTVCIDCGVGVW